MNCSHAPGLTEPSEESPIAGWPLLLGGFAQAQTKEIWHRAYLKASNRHFIVWHETRRGITWGDVGPAEIEADESLVLPWLAPALLP